MAMLWTVLGCAAFLGYNIFLFFFASKLLVGAKKNPLLWAFLSILNLSSVFLFFMYGTPRYLIYPLLALVLILEFKLISKAAFTQAAFGALAFMLNISPAHLLTGLLLSALRGVSAFEVWNSLELLMQTFVICFSALSLTLFIFMKFVPTESVLHVSRAKGYRGLISLTALLLLLSSSFDVWLFVRDHFYIEMLQITLVNTLLYYTVFFYIVLFSINLINLHAFKRKSDDAELSYHQIINKKSEVEQQLFTDDLTGCYNRKYAHHKLDALLDDPESRFFLFFMDLTALKYVNDRFGHAAGDRYILRVSSALKHALRITDTVARLGGDEFLALVEDVDESELPQMLERIRMFLTVQNNLEDFLVHVNIGCVFVPNDAPKPQKAALLEEADFRMRADKQAFYDAMRKPI